MGILNVTPASFANRASLRDPADAVAAALRMEADGADLIDIGGESTRPGAEPVAAGEGRGAEPVAAEEELARVLPVLRALHGRIRVPLSIDTYKADVARAAIAAGAVMVNDVSGLRRDPGLTAAVTETGAALVLMHSRGSSKTMYAEAQYDDVAADVSGELQDALRTAAAGGVAPDRVIVDPGVGFAKRPSHSYGVLAGLPAIAAALDRPVL